MKLIPKNKILRMLRGGNIIKALHGTNTGRFKSGLYKEFVGSLYPALRLELISRGYNESDSSRLATFATQQAAFESGYGTNAQASNYNYGGLTGGRNYGSYGGYAKAYYDMISKKWGSALKAGNIDEYIQAIHTNNGLGIYSTTPVNQYLSGVKGVSKRTISYIPKEQPTQEIKYVPQTITNPKIPAPRDAFNIKTPIIDRYVAQ